jgi:hypothetical protein
MSIQTAGRLADRVSMASASSSHPDAGTAVAELAGALGDTAPLFAVFVTPGYDLDATAAAIQTWCGGRVIACTSSGNIGPDGYAKAGMIAVSFSGGGLRARTIPVGSTDVSQAVEQVSVDLSELHAMWEDSDGFAVLLVDGLTRREDRLAAALMAALGDVPIIGGSAGDGLTFTRTAVLCDGHFVDDGATLTMVTLDTPFRLFRLQHHEPSDIILVATDATPDQRLVRALNGRTAAEAYAEAVGLSLDALDPVVFSTHPLILLAAGQSWVRSISAVNPDGSLSMFAAVQPGDALRLGRPVGMIEKLEARFADVTADLGRLSGVLAFDCVLRRLEFEERGIDTRIGRLLAEKGAVGFSTYGEQFNGMHMNQTLVAVAFGAGSDPAN